MSAREIPELLLLGVGGGGCRIAHSVRKAYGPGIRALCVDTDAMTSRMEPLDGVATLLLGGSRLSGQGAGGDPVQGRLAAQDDLANVAAHLKGVRTAVVIACLGAGTGGGATPEIVKRLHDAGIVVICFAALPFAFEGRDRAEAARRAQPLIDENADSFIAVPQDSLFADAGGETLEEALRRADGILAAGLSLLWRSVASPGFISLDPERLHRLALCGGSASFGFASASGEGRAEAAVKALCSAALLRKGEAVRKANAILLGILAGSDLRLAELDAVMSALRKLCSSSCKIEMGVVRDDRFNGRIELALTAFQSWKSAAFEAEAASASAPLEPSIGEIPAHSGSRRRKGSRLSFGPNGKGKFQNVEPTLENGQDLDVPAYMRRGITLER